MPRSYLSRAQTGRLVQHPNRSAWMLNQPPRPRLSCVLVLSVFTSAVPAQRGGGTSATALADDFKPCSTNVAGQQYPEVNSKRQVRFRINAPQSTSVRVLGTNLVKGEDG